MGPTQPRGDSGADDGSGLEVFVAQARQEGLRLAHEARFGQAGRPAPEGPRRPRTCRPPCPRFAAPLGLPELQRAQGQRGGGVTDLITVAKYWHRWADPRFVDCVLSNGDLNQVTWELRAMADSPRVPKTQDVPPMSYAAYAEILGLKASR